MDDQELMKYIILFLTKALNVEGQYDAPDAGESERPLVDATPVAKAMGISGADQATFEKSLKSNLGGSFDSLKPVSSVLLQSLPSSYSHGPKCPAKIDFIIRIAAAYQASLATTTPAASPQSVPAEPRPA